MTDRRKSETAAVAEAVRQQIPLLAAESAPNNAHYLDNAATALMPEAVLDAVRAYDDSNRGNVGRGVHRFAEAADEAYQAARATTAAALAAVPEEIVFTAGATAGLNLLALALGSRLGRGDCVLLSLAEHHSNIVPWQLAARRHGFSLLFAAPDGAGADSDELRRLIAEKKPRVIAVAHATNVGGGVADLPALAAAKSADAVLIADGCQYAPHQLPDLPTCGADFYVFSGHKCYAPNGIGVLWGKRAQLENLPPVTGGGGSIREVTTADSTIAPPPAGLEPGTPPISPAVGLAAALRWRQTLPAAAADNTRRLARRLRRGLAAMPRLRLLFADEEEAVIVPFVVEGVHSHDVCEILAAAGVAMRGGHHCAEPLMRYLEIDGCVRASFAPYNTDADCDAALQAVEQASALWGSD